MQGDALFECFFELIGQVGAETAADGKLSAWVSFASARVALMPSPAAFSDTASKSGTISVLLLFNKRVIKAILMFVR